MEKKDFDNYLLAGKIWKKAMKKAEKSVKPGRKLLDIALEIEKGIFDAGKELKAKNFGPAFPVNLSINEEAAHSTPSGSDSRVLDEKDVLKIDIGVHVGGFISDGAKTLNFSNDYSKMIEANEKALENAIALIKPNIEVSKVGKTIQDTLKKSGFNPVQNLSGHGLQKFEQHASPSIPNIENNDSRKILDGMAVAVEPFASTGKGLVHESSSAEIFSVKEAKPVRNMHARTILEFVSEKYSSLPFAERWIEKEMKLSDFQRKIGLRELLKFGVLESYPVLKEDKGAIITQAEKTVVIFEGKVSVIN